MTKQSGSYGVNLDLDVNFSGGLIQTLLGSSKRYRVNRRH